MIDWLWKQLENKLKQENFFFGLFKITAKEFFSTAERAAVCVRLFSTFCKNYFCFVKSAMFALKEAFEVDEI